LIRQKHFTKEAQGLAYILAQAKASANNTVLFVTNKKAKWDFIILFNVMQGMDLTGVRFILAARPGDRKKFEPLVKASGADFVFINRLKEQH